MKIVVDLPLPELRQDLKFIEGPVALDGSPSWTIQDKTRNKYFSIGWQAFQLLSRWSAGQSSALVKRVNEETTLNIVDEDVKKLLLFLYGNNLTIKSINGSSYDYLEQYSATKKSFFVWLVHNYLFFKIPLVRPTAFLRRTVVYVEPLFSNLAVTLILLAGLIGLYIVGRQWDYFFATFLYFFNIQGLGFYIVSLVIIKILHELGHAYTATRYGCKVPTMGFAMLVLFPVLYTDASDAWRIKSAKKRIHIGIAGMCTEFYIACIALFCWGFLPDGIYRSIAFILATTGLISTLIINLNILMRFDGYYILSDILGIQNLQKRAFDIGKWKLTELLFNIKEPTPESLSISMIRKLYIYAWCVWVYRFFLFIGIALLVYHFFFKALGVILFVIEISWFILFPIIGMLRSWWKMKDKIIKTMRFYITLLLLAGLIGLFIYPWNATIRIPAVYKSQQKSILFTPDSAYIESSFLVQGKRVVKDEVLMILKSPQIEQQIETTLKKIEVLQMQMRRVVANSEELSNIQVLVQQLQEEQSKLVGLDEKNEKLIVRAPVSGVIYDVAGSLHQNRWLNKKLPLAIIIEPTLPTIEGVVFETDLRRLKANAAAKFIPDNPQLEPISAYVDELEQANLQVLDMPMLASIYGGHVPAQLDRYGQIHPDKSIYRVRFNLSTEGATVEKLIRGMVHVEGDKQSFFNRAYNLIVSVLVRESGI